MIATLRTLTKKSKLGFGKNKDYTVENLLSRNKHIDLVSAYYKLTSINFTDDILNELKIQKDNIIEKPGTNYDMYKIVLLKYPSKYRNRELEKMIPKRKLLTKQQLQARNHGR